MIVDCFTFFNEFDILDIRLEELYPVVDKFIIVESNLTFSGNEKPMHFYDNQERYEKYADKIVWYKHWEEPGGSAWDREYRQRNAIMTPLVGLRLDPHDIVLLSDADEIPRRSVVESLDPQPIQAVGLPAFYYGLNVYGGHQHTIRAVRWHEFFRRPPQDTRTIDVDTLPVIWDGGWHFSYLGDVDHIAHKFQSFAHTELNRFDTTDPETLAARMRAGTDLWGDGHQYEIKTIDDTWPEAVKRDRDRWRKFEWD